MTGRTSLSFRSSGPPDVPKTCPRASDFVLLPVIAGGRSRCTALTRSGLVSSLLRPLLADLLEDAGLTGGCSGSLILLSPLCPILFVASSISFVTGDAFLDRDFARWDVASVLKTGFCFVGLELEVVFAADAAADKFSFLVSDASTTDPDNLIGVADDGDTLLCDAVKAEDEGFFAFPSDETGLPTVGGAFVIALLADGSPSSASFPFSAKAGCLPFDLEKGSGASVEAFGSPARPFVRVRGIDVNAAPTPAAAAAVAPARLPAESVEDGTECLLGFAAAKAPLLVGNGDLEEFTSFSEKDLGALCLSACVPSGAVT